MVKFYTQFTNCSVGGNLVKKVFAFSTFENEVYSGHLNGA